MLACRELSTFDKFSFPPSNHCSSIWCSSRVCGQDEKERKSRSGGRVSRVAGANDLARRLQPEATVSSQCSLVSNQETKSGIPRTDGGWESAPVRRCRIALEAPEINPPAPRNLHFIFETRAWHEIKTLSFKVNTAGQNLLTKQICLLRYLSFSLLFLCCCDR